ncbi:poly [Dorcoceras hygrometricum]|uniref:Poly n=1 Tax=Dorcoceras hygrometricum TaxID=472368 RepID=A0A2Z7ADR5_9LAMI|nr:poly [Dorcoceras hygrometricum]
MSLFDLQDVCIVIRSLATLDLPMVVDLIGIYVLKGPYCTLTTTNWFLQALSVIPRGSWGDVARRFTMIRWATSILHTRPPLLSLNLTPRAAVVCRHLRYRTCFDHRNEEFPSVLNSSVLLVQADEGVLISVPYLSCKFKCKLLDLVGGHLKTVEMKIKDIEDQRSVKPEALDTASRGPTTIVTQKSQFRTCPTDHDNIGYPRVKASGESSTTKHRLLHASGPHPIPPPNDPNRCYLEIEIAKRCRLHKLIRQRFAIAIKIQQEDFALIISADEATMDSVAMQRYPDAIDEQDASNSSIQSRAYLNQLLLINQSQALHIQSTWFPGAKNHRRSKAQQLKNESAAKQLTTYEELSKMNVNC